MGVAHPGDTVLVRMVERVSVQNAKALVDALRNALPEGTAFVVLDDSVEVTILRTGDRP